MRTLLILRHAKSSWKEPGMADHDRPLNARGRRDAPRVGQWLLEQQLVPHQIFCSSAHRARTTAELVAETCRFDVTRIDVVAQLYLADPETYIQHLRQHAEGERPVLVIGHNPGLEGLVHLLTGAGEHLPTAALAQIRLDLNDWSQWHRETPAELLFVWRPKQQD